MEFWTVIGYVIAGLIGGILALWLIYLVVRGGKVL